MLPSVVLPLVGVVVLALAATSIHRRLPPILATRVVTIAVVAVLVATAPTMMAVALGYAAHLPYLGPGFSWCAHALAVHEQVPTTTGVIAIVLTGAGAARAAMVIRAHLRLRRDDPGSIEIARHSHPFAYALPGRGGHIIVSTGLIEMLDERERMVVLAHETAHVAHRHDRHLLLAQLAAVAVPVVRPLVARLRFSLERWADEAAVERCGDRHLVARTLGKVALVDATPRGALGLAGLGVPARVAALFAPPAPRPASPSLVALWTALATTVALVAVQLHHLLPIVRALLPS